MPAGKCGSDISQVWRGVPDPRPEGALYWDSGRTTQKCGGNMRMLREPHIKPHPVVGKCATRTFSSNPSVVKLRSEESSLKRPMLREPHIKGVRPGYSRAYISLYYVRAQSHALLARIMPARDIETRARNVLDPPAGGRVGIDIETIRGSTRLGSLPLQRYGGPVQDSPGRPESQYRRPESQYRIHASQYRIHASQYRIHVTHY